MFTNVNIEEVLDKAIRDITKRMARIEIQDAPSQTINAANASSLVVTTSGDYVLTIVLFAENNVFHAIAENMKHDIIESKEEVSIYVTEYLNVICGHVVAFINNKAHASARFQIPQLVQGRYSPNEEYFSKRQFYRCSFGVIETQTACQGCLLVS